MIKSGQSTANIVGRNGLHSKTRCLKFTLTAKIKMDLTVMY